MFRLLILAVAFSMLVAICGCGRENVVLSDSEVAEVVAAELNKWPEFVDKSRFEKLVDVFVQTNDSTVAAVVRLRPRAGREDVERLLGFGLMNIAKSHNLSELGFIADGEGWTVLANASRFYQGEVTKR